MKKLISSLLFIFPLIAFSQQFDLQVDNNSSLDVFVVVYETANCSPYARAGSQGKQVLSYDNEPFSSITRYMYEIKICQGITSSCGSCSNAVLNLGYDVNGGTYSGIIRDCSTGVEVDVVWTTNIKCEDISLEITDQ